MDMICPHSPALNPAHQMTSGTQKTSRGHEKIAPPRSEALSLPCFLLSEEERHSGVFKCGETPVFTLSTLSFSISGEIRKDVGGAYGAFVVFSAQGSLELF